MARFCKNCGAQLSENAKFCRGCGRAVGAPQANNMQALNQAPVQNMRMNAGNVCQNCGNALRPGVRFCRTCGMAAGTNVQTGNAYGMNMMPQKKKRSKLFYPLVALVTALAVAVVSVGGYFLYDRVISPRIGSGNKDIADMSYPQGNSKAFSITPLEGITISAEKNALKQDTDISFTLKNDDSYYEKYREPLNELGSEPLVAFDFDMGLEPEECIPGYVDMTFDLGNMGIPQDLWEDVEVYRQRDIFDENAPEDSFEKYASDINDKGVLSFRTTKNCSIIVTIAVGVGIVVGSGIQYYKYYEETKHFDSSKSITLRNRDKWDYDLIVNLDDTEVPNEKDKYKGVMESTQAFNKYVKELYGKAEKAYADYVIKKAAEGQNAFTYSWLDEFLRIREMKEKIDRNLFIKGYFDKDEKFKEMSSNLVIPDSVKRTIEVINDSYEYINSQSIKIPARVVSFYMLPIDGLGLKVSGLTYPSYMQLNSLALVIGGKYNPKGIDGFRLTCTHEFFHLCQEEYAFGGYTRKGKEIIEDTRFEEATAAVLEKDASFYYFNKGIQTEDPNQPPGGSLDYVARNENYCYCYPLNEKPNPSGGEDTTINIGYTEADLIDFLREKQKNVSVAALMNVYGNTLSQGSFVDILRNSGAFDIKKDEKWSELFHEFCLDHAKRIADQTQKGEKQYPDYLIRSVASFQDGYVFDWESAYQNIACVKTIKQVPPNGIKKKYVVIFEINDEAADDDAIMIRLLNNNGEQTWKERNYTDAVVDDTLVFYSRANSTVPLKINAICICEPEAPMISREGSTVRVTTTPAPSNLLKNNKVSALRTVIRRNKKEVVYHTPVNSQDPKNQLGQDIIIDVSDLGDGADEEFECTQAWIYIDPKGNDYEGPEVKGMFGSTITGTWRFESLSQYSSALMGGIADTMEKYVPYAGKELGEYVQHYGDILRGQSGIPGSGKLTIVPGNEKDKYVVTIKYSEQQAPVEVYDADYDASTSTLTMKSRPKNYTDDKGNSYDLSQFGLQTDMVLKIETVNGNKKGEQNLVFNGSGQNDQTSQIVAYKILISGMKISDSIEELK